MNKRLVPLGEGRECQVLFIGNHTMLVSITPLPNSQFHIIPNMVIPNRLTTYQKLIIKYWNLCSIPNVGRKSQQDEK